jgi:membrane protease YdiL (CAAX protease family)
MTSYLKKYPTSFQVIVFVGLYIGCTAIYYFVLMAWAMPHLTGVTLTDLQSGDMANPYLMEVMKWMQLLYTVVSFLIPAWLFFYLSDPSPLRYAGMRARFRTSAIVLAILILVASLPMVGVLGDWNQQIHFGSLDQSLRALNEKAQQITRAMLVMPDGGSLVFNLILIALVPAIAEEMFFRGVIQRLLVRITRRAWLGILIASIIFSLLHGEMLGFFPRVALGVVLGLIYYISNNLWYPIAAHFVNNGFQVLLFFLFQHHYTTYDISKSEPTPLVAGILSLAVVVVLCWVFWQFRRGEGVADIFGVVPRAAVTPEKEPNP